MTKYFLLGVVVLFSFNALANIDKIFWPGYDKQQVVKEIPALLEKTLDQYPELKGTLEFDMESLQLSLSVPVYLLAAVNYVWMGTDNWQRYTLEMDVVDTGSRAIMKLNCKLIVGHEVSAPHSFEMFFHDIFRASCLLIHPGEKGEEQVFVDSSRNPRHTFQAYPTRPL